MTPNEQLVYDTLEARYFDLRNIIAAKLKRSPDSEEVDAVATQAVCKCLRGMGKFDPVKGKAWPWVLMVTWGCIIRSRRSTQSKDKTKRRVPVDAMGHLGGAGEEGVEGVIPERPKEWRHGAEEDCLLTAIDLKREGIDGEIDVDGRRSK